MGQHLDRFFAGTSKPLCVAFLGFVVAFVGVALGFSIDYGPANPLSYVAFGIGILGWLITMGGIAWGWYTFFAGSPALMFLVALGIRSMIFGVVLGSTATLFLGWLIMATALAWRVLRRRP